MAVQMGNIMKNSILSTFAGSSSNPAISDFRQGIDTHICNYM
nr:unnamed protein product [Meloidogyne enterolobii]